MESGGYDEDLSQNPFFQALQQRHSQLLERCITEGWIICVPRCGTFNKDGLTDHNFLGQILMPDIELPGTRFNTLTQRDVKLNNKSLVVEYEDGKTSSFKLLFEEIFYNEDLDKYSLWCVEGLLEQERGKSDQDQLVSVVATLKDCVNFLWTEISEKSIIGEVDRAVEDFIEETDLENESLDSQKHLVEFLYSKSLSTLLKDKKLRDKSTENKFYAQILRVVAETYVLNGLRKVLCRSVSMYTAEEDANLNKIIRNLGQLQPCDLGIGKNCFYDGILRAKLELSRLNDYFTILGKVGCLRRAAKFVSRNESSMSSDDFLPLLIMLVVKSGLGNWIAQLSFLKSFRFSENSADEAGFLVTSLEAAIQHISSGCVSPVEFSGTTATTPSNGNFGSIRLNVLFENVKCGNLGKVRDLLDELQENQLCHPLCACDSCRNRKATNNDARDEFGLTALHVASIYGQDAILDLILKRGADPNARDHGEMTPLHHACSRGHQNITLLLLYAGADPLAQEQQMANNPLHLSCDRGHEACCKALLCVAVGKNRIVDCGNRDGNTPLHFASKWGFVTIVKMLLEYGANLSAKNRRGQTPLTVAHNVYVRRLLENSSSSQPNSGNGAKKLLQQVKQKIQLRKDPSTKVQSSSIEDSGKIIDKLFAAINDGDVWLASYYLGLDGPSSNNQSVDQSMCHPLCNCEKCLALLMGEELPVFEKETKPVIAVNAVNEEGESALHVASSLGCLDMIQLLLDAGARVNLATKSEGRTPLHLACVNNQINAVKMLVNSGSCNVDAEDRNKDTPLNVASRAGYLKIVEILVRNGADIAHNSSHSEKI